ncbi:MAG: hypothetical protein ACRETQ_12730 [Gammaproteobacteria bacterium]
MPPLISGVNHLDAVRAFENAGQSNHIVISDGIRILIIPRHNPINAYTPGGLLRDVGALLSSR